MTLQISPVLAGTYDTTPVASANNIGSAQTDTQTDSADAVDSRRYTKFDRSATEAGTATMSFGDFIDMINPLQHIPVVSSVYREISGDTINPVSRIVGDIVYGGVAGIASAVIGGVAAVRDAVVESATGKDATGNVVAALFGTDQAESFPVAPTTQVAQAGSAATVVANIQTAASQTNMPTTAQANAPTAAQINARAKLQALAVAAAASASTQASMPSTGTSSPAAQMASSASATGSGLLNSLNANPATSLAPLSGTKSFALDPKKLPYGGVMAPPLQGNNMALSLANSAPGMQMNHMVYTARSNTTKPSAIPTASANPPAAATTPLVLAPSLASDLADNSAAYVSTSGPDALPSSLVSDIAALRAINMYRSTAQTGSSAPSVDVIN